FSFVLAVQNARNRLERNVQWNVGDETQAPVVDAHHGHVIECQLAGSAEHGAVAAHDDGQVGLCADGGVIGYDEFGDPGVAGRFGFDEHLAARSLYRIGQIAQWRVEAAVLVPANESNGVEMHGLKGESV